MMKCITISVNNYRVRDNVKDEHMSKLTNYSFYAVLFNNLPMLLTEPVNKSQ